MPLASRHVTLQRKLPEGAELHMPGFHLNNRTSLSAMQWVVIAVVGAVAVLAVVLFFRPPRATIDPARVEAIVGNGATTPTSSVEQRRMEPEPEDIGSAGEENPLTPDVRPAP